MSDQTSTVVKPICPFTWVDGNVTQRKHSTLSGVEELTVHDSGSCGHPLLSDSCLLSRKYSCNRPNFSPWKPDPGLGLRYPTTTRAKGE